MTAGLTMIITLLNPLFGGIFAALAVQNDRRFRQLYVVVIAVLIGIMAYNLVPSRETADLARYFYWIDHYFRGHSFEHIWQNYGSQGLFVVQPLIYFLVGLTQNNQLLPFGVMLIASLCNLTVITRLCDKYQINMTKCILIYLCLMPFPIADLGVRTVLSFSLASLAIYRDLEAHRRGLLTWLIYLLAISVHVAGLIIVLMRLVLLLKVHWRPNPIRAIFKLSAMIVIIAIGLVGLTQLGVFDLFLTKSSSYFGEGGDVSYVEYLSNSIYMRLIRLFYLMVFGYMSLILWLRRHTTGLTNKDGYTYALLLSVVALISFISKDSVYLRLTFILPTLMAYLYVGRSANQSRRQLIGDLFLTGLCIGGVMIQITYLSLNTNLFNFMIHVFQSGIVNLILTGG
ncbi:hypothetical protein [Furfurilactobacillus curtus]|uniref:EpsG family protein n=1 Tax=Furfurilactobacillus curtus TaxID=1746200 RepID=A0ABQ5JNR4_9LACO